jgi:hypothetical protein
MNKRRRFSEMSAEELTAYDQSASYARGRADAFDHGKPETIDEYWEREEPSDAEVRVILRNVVRQLARLS